MEGSYISVEYLENCSGTTTSFNIMSHYTHFKGVYVCINSLQTVFVGNPTPDTDEQKNWAITQKFCNS